MVDFCSNCGSIIMGKKGEDVNCPSCGESQKAKATVKLSIKVQKKEEMEVLSSEDKSKEIHPLIDMVCPKCGHGRAYFWTKQMRAGDEPETQFFKCEGCNNQWRDYS